MNDFEDRPPVIEGGYNEDVSSHEKLPDMHMLYFLIDIGQNPGITEHKVEVVNALDRFLVGLYGRIKTITGANAEATPKAISEQIRRPIGRLTQVQSADLVDNSILVYFEYCALKSKAHIPRTIYRELLDSTLAPSQAIKEIVRKYGLTTEGEDLSTAEAFLLARGLKIARHKSMERVEAEAPAVGLLGKVIDNVLGTLQGEDPTSAQA